MSIRTILVVLLAVMFGLSAAWGVNQLRTPVVVESKLDTSPVVVAALDIPRGQVLQETDVVLRDWPKDMLPEGTLANLKNATSRSAMYPLVAGEPILERKLASAESGRGLASLVPAGMRAYTIQSSKVAATVAGFVLPGNRVDVLLNLRGQPNDETGGGSTTTLLQSVEILAVNQNLDAPAENKTNPNDLQSVTLLVTPDQAALLDLGQNLGVLTLSLRNPEDKTEADTRPAVLADVRYRQEKPVELPDAL
ncbi:MAG: Flp pilus assembly protein CpaB, partial [Pirellulaceae bacterium]|nr:Flp pilus assembly protein CpaB [Pirellulaceae bacterium]